MAQEVIDLKFNKIRLANWSDSGFVDINGSNEQEKLGSVGLVKGQPFDLVKGQHI